VVRNRYENKCADECASENTDGTTNDNNGSKRPRRLRDTRQSRVSAYANQKRKTPSASADSSRRS